MTLRARPPATVVSAALMLVLLFVPASASADPPCQNGAALLMWARGSGQGFNDQTVLRWRSTISAALPGVRVADVELGNEDGNFRLEAGEYPAVGVLTIGDAAAILRSRGTAVGVVGARRLDKYFNSRELGTNGLVAYLNDRARRCGREAFVLGGFSQGADVVGAAIGRDGYGSLSPAARNQLAVVTQYGDPSHYKADGLLPGRPRPSFLLRANRIGSWCDYRDPVCNARSLSPTAFTFEHGPAYRDRYMPDVAGWVAKRTLSKITELAPPPPSSSPQSPSPPMKPPVVQGAYSQQQGRLGVDTFLEPRNASGKGPRITPGQWIQVSCKLYAPAIASVNPDGYWYRILSAPWSDRFYAPANSFMNGDPWGGPFGNNTDFGVPDCPSGAPTEGGSTGGGSSGGGSPPAGPKPYAGNLVVVDHGGGHVGIAFDVGWQAGRDPVTCHTFRNGVEIATDQCGTRSSKQFYGVPSGTHSFYATVSDRFGVFSDPTNTVVKTISAPPPAPPLPAERMCCDARLYATDDEYLRSMDGRYRLVMQADSNLVLYAPSGAIWTTSTVGRGANHLRMQGDGNLVMYDGANRTIWASNTPRHYNTYLIVQNDGNVVIYDNGRPIWATNTAGRT